jgi:protein tyrosine phosphatase (PTP) superfamily phosphohydrolase (DUF442 family)
MAPSGWTPNFSWVAPDLAVGGSFPAGVAARLAAEHGVGAVVDLRAEACDDAEELEACGLTFLHLPTEDLCGVSQAGLDEGVAFARRMTAEGRKLLVHCHHGIGRSATLALCILVDRGVAPLTALIQAKDARWLVSPSESQYQAWSAWVARRAPAAAMPSYHEFGIVAYRHLAQQA